MTIQTEDIPYEDDGVNCLGYLAYDDTATDARPGVLVVHEAWGLGNHAQERARMLAAQGYVAFAADLFGDRRQVTPQEVRTVIGPLAAEPAVLRKRAYAALSALAGQPRVDASRLFGIGFCFGGSTVLELARDGADLLGVVGFHCKLATEAPAEPGRVRASVLTLIGAEDPLIELGERVAFEEEMRNAGADWQIVLYGDTQHSFTNPEADGSVMPSAIYDARADRRAWSAMTTFFEELLDTSGP